MAIAAKGQGIALQKRPLCCQGLPDAFADPLRRHHGGGIVAHPALSFEPYLYPGVCVILVYHQVAPIPIPLSALIAHNHACGDVCQTQGIGESAGVMGAETAATLKQEVIDGVGIYLLRAESVEKRLFPE